ncbi:hypothetical protein HID58_023203 [Brassica napus]|uniref:Uncharacterized protein n=2 Tax=Brassica TaxID=3705 RepID=A0ABQ8D3S9_BRANA|nr:hypothetical protein HID58_023203 [Brassica napus]
MRSIGFLRFFFLNR